jgi:DNA modification methylase
MNKLFYGDNLQILRKYVQDETVDLCYIDPPFNSKRNYNQIYNNIGKEDAAQAQAFIDTWTWDTDAEKGLLEIQANFNGVFTLQSIQLILGFENVLGKGSLLSYLVHMTQRIAEIYRVLKPTGSFYLHCDPSASHYLKIILDSIFCSRQGVYQNEITWQRTNVHNDAKQGRRAYGNVADIIFFYTKTDNNVFHQQYLKHNEEYLDSFYKFKDPDGRRYSLGDLGAPGGEDKGNPYYEFLGIKRFWRFSEDNMKKLYAEGMIIQTKPGTVPRQKRYLDSSKGIPVQNIWTDIKPLQSGQKEKLGYPTQKPESLLERIILSSSNEGDTILDAYCGCGTTVAVAERLNRNWIGIDITYQSISLILKRLEEHFGAIALKNIKLSGVPEDFESAEALAHRQDDKTRKEFEKWAVLSYSGNRGMINEKKGGDGGIDGVAFLYDLKESDKQKQEVKQIIFSVKSNKSLPPSVIRDLNGTIERDKAVIGILITLYPMDNLVKESKKYGTYENKLFGHSYQKIEVVSIADILEGKTMKIPTSLEVLKKAEQKPNNKQQELDF